MNKKTITIIILIAVGAIAKIVTAGDTNVTLEDIELSVGKKEIKNIVKGENNGHNGNIYNNNNRDVNIYNEKVIINNK